MSEVKVNKISPRTNCGTVTVGDSGDSVSVTAGVPVTVNGDLKSNALKAVDGGSIISQCGTNITLGASGDTINLAAGASQTGFGRTGTVDWDTTAKTAAFTAVSGNGYFCNTTSGAFTATLPAGTAGAIVSFADYAATWQTNNLTVSPDGTDKIGGVNTVVALNTEGQSVTFVYVDSTQGWINTMDSTSNVRAVSLICASVSGACNTLTTIDTDYKLATFTGPGTFTVNSGENLVDYVVVAGGGGGGGDDGGGGGAGGYRESHSDSTSGPYTASPLAGTSLPLGPGAFPITVGGGGTGSPNNGTNGSNSVFSSITSAGGGFGGRNPTAGGPGGSGGGGGGGASGAGGTGNTPPVSPAQGTNGGNATPASNGGGGGGGAGAGGNNGSGCGSGADAGPGGNGVSTSITGSSVTRAGGGGGGAFQTKGNGGSGGGGTGAQYPNTQATAGTVNTGGGGGGGSTSTGCRTGKSGGSGIVIIRYKFQ